MAIFRKPAQDVGLEPRATDTVEAFQKDLEKISIMVSKTRNVLFQFLEKQLESQAYQEYLRIDNHFGRFRVHFAEAFRSLETFRVAIQ
jgi:hypothetical protein